MDSWTCFHIPIVPASGGLRGGVLYILSPLHWLLPDPTHFFQCMVTSGLLPAVHLGLQLDSRCLSTSLTETVWTVILNLDMWCWRGLEYCPSRPVSHTSAPFGDSTHFESPVVGFQVSSLAGEELPQSCQCPPGLCQ